MQEVLRIGNLRLATGRLVVCDPFWGHFGLRQLEPVQGAIDPDDYSVEAAVTRWASLGSTAPVELLAAVRLKISDRRVLRWERAWSSIDSGESISVGVDSGVACFIDASETETLVKINRPNGQLDQALGEFKSQLAVKFSRADDTLELIAFKTPFGDGSYPLWVGYSDSGDPAVIVCAFDLLNRSLE